MNVIVAGVMKMGNIVPRAGATSIADQCANHYTT